jgi:hypothetical protein
VEAHTLRMMFLSLRMSKPIHMLTCLAACLLLMGGLSEARAALSGPQVLEAMLKQMGPAKTILVRQRVENIVPVPEPEAGTGALVPSAEGTAEALSDQPTEPPPVLTEALTYQLPGGFRAEVRSEAIQRLYLEVDGDALLTVDGHLVPMGGGWFETFKDLFLYTRRLDLHRQLALKGVDVAIASLGLWNERPVHVLGAYFPDAAPAQIWVDKETLLPVRWLWETAIGGPEEVPIGQAPIDGAPQGAGHIYEIRYDRWQLFGKRRYPLRVQFFENHELVRTLVAEAVVVNAEVEAGSMDLTAVRRLALPPLGDPPLTGEGSDPAVDPAVDEIHEAIDIFKKRFE